MKTPITVAESHYCPHCEKTLRHNRAYCPLFPEVCPPPEIEYEETPTGLRRVKVPGNKWSRCVCLVHSCFDAAALRRAL